MGMMSTMYGFGVHHGSEVYHWYDFFIETKSDKMIEMLRMMMVKVVNCC